MVQFVGYVMPVGESHDAILSLPVVWTKSPAASPRIQDHPTQHQPECTTSVLRCYGQENATLLGDHQRDKDMQRNHTIAIVLMTVLVFLYLYLFPPQAPVRQEARTEPTAIEQSATPDEAPPVSAFTQQVESLIAAEKSTASADTPDDAANLAAKIAALAFDPDVAPANTYALHSSHLDLEFTDVGARLKQGTVLVEHGEPQPLVPLLEGDVREDVASYPMGLQFQASYLADHLDHLRWTEVPTSDGNSLQFTIELPDPLFATITKTFTISAEHPNVVQLAVAFTNTGTESRRLGLDNAEPSFSLVWSPDVHSGDEDNRMSHQELVWREDETNIHFATSKLEPAEDGTPAKVMPSPKWLAIKSAYFVVAMKADYEEARGWADGLPKNFQVALDVPRMEVAAGATETRNFKLYMGPVQGASLAAAWPGLNTVLQFFTMFSFMDTFAKGMLFVVNWFYGNIMANYGFAIIFLTILVRSAMFPLTLKGMKSMKKMQKLAPQMEEIKKEVGEDQQEMQKRMMQLYKERGVNPLGGCMPMLLQTPVFIALYRVYATAFEFRGAPFAGWITDLSKPDGLFDLPFTIPVPFMANGIDTFNLLPILMGVAMVASTKLMPTSGPVQNPQQKMMMTFMPVIFSVICYNMASGLNLYILTSTVLGIVQNYFIHVSDEELKAKPGAVQKGKSGAKSKPRHFYAAAQARKREMAKEQRREKKKGRPGKGQDQ